MDIRAVVCSPDTKVSCCTISQRKVEFFFLPQVQTLLNSSFTMDSDSIGILQQKCILDDQPDKLSAQQWADSFTVRQHNCNLKIKKKGK